MLMISRRCEPHHDSVNVIFVDAHMTSRVSAMCVYCRPLQAGIDVSASNRVYVGAATNLNSPVTWLLLCSRAAGSTAFLLP